jgi:hypothetical protein
MGRNEKTFKVQSSRVSNKNMKKKDEKNYSGLKELSNLIRSR